MDKLKEAHDKLLAEMAEDETHEEETCPFCNPSLVPENSEERGGMKTYTEEELNAVVAPIQAELDRLKSDLSESEVEARIAEAKEEASKSVAVIQAELDEKVLEASEATKKYDELVAQIAADKEAAEKAELEAARKDERLAAIKEIVDFPEDHIAKNVDRWVAMDDDAFADQLETYKLIAAKIPVSDESVVDGADGASLHDTAMQGRIVEGGKVKAISAIGEIIGARQAGVNIRTLKN